MTHLRVLILLAVIVLFVGPYDRATQAAGVLPSFTTTSCPFSAPPPSNTADDNTKSDWAVRCGYVTVAENHNLPTSRSIKLAVAIYTSATSTAAQTATPLIYLQGGPGQSLLGSLQGPGPWDPMSAALVEQRPVILFDQRGIGYSTPNLDCPEMASVGVIAATDQLATVATITQTLQQTRQCHNDLSSAGIDLTAYTTRQSAADVDAIRRALGYTTISLYGISYGARLALETMRDYPDTISSVVLDSVVPPDANPTFSEVTPNYAAALHTFFAGCAASSACNTAYPQLEPSFYALIDKLNAHPYQHSGVEIDGNTLLALVHLQLADTTAMRALPGLIFKALKGDLEQIAAFTASLRAGSNTHPGAGIAAYLSIMCGEGGNATPEQVLAAGQDVPPEVSRYTETTVLNTLMLCSVWGQPSEPITQTTPLSSTIPTLLLSGSYDPTTPAAYATHVASTLANHFSYVFPGQGHGQDYSGTICPINITLDFLAKPSVAPARASCIAAMKGPQWILPSSTGCNNIVQGATGEVICVDPRVRITTALQPTQPQPGTDVTFRARLTLAGKGIANVPSTITWHFLAQQVVCKTKTDREGYAVCTEHLPDAPNPYSLYINVTFTGYGASAGAVFQPLL